MIASLGLILLCQLLGEIVVRSVSAPVPGPVVGLMILLGDGGVESAASGMLAHLSLLFVPAGVGVVQHLDLVSSHGIAIFVILALSAFVTLVVTAAAFIITSKLLDRWRGTSS